MTNGAGGTKWVIDPAHTLVEFAVKHLMIATVKGRFAGVEGEVIGDPNDLTTASIDVSIDVKSVDTREAQRDEHLRSADFFDIEKFPKMTFKSRQITKTGENQYDVEGDLTIRDVTRPITLAATVAGTSPDPWGGERVGVSAEATLNRKDFGLTWNTTLETGGVLVGDEVKISLEVQAVRQNES